MALSTVALLPGISGGATIKGSDTMVVLNQRFAEVYARESKSPAFEVTGGGSGTGIAALLNGMTEIAASSRPIKAEEAAQFLVKTGGAVIEIPVAMDAIAIFVHRTNELPAISIPQLAAVFAGKIRNWKELGGPDRPIVVYSRENNSGTYAFFKEHVLKDADFFGKAQTLPGTAAVINAVARDPTGIGYGGIGYAKGIRVLPVSTKERAQPVEPTEQSAADGSYPISRYLYYYSTASAMRTPQVGALVQWILGDAGQAVVNETGSFPLPKEKRISVTQQVGGWVATAAPAIPPAHASSATASTRPIPAPTAAAAAAAPAVAPTPVAVDPLRLVERESNVTRREASVAEREASVVGREMKLTEREAALAQREEEAMARRTSARR